MKGHFRNIFCAADFSEFSGSVAAYGIAMARWFKARLYICHVIDLPTVSVYGEAVFDPLEYQNRFMDTARHEIDRMLGDAGVEYQPLVTVGSTTEEISRLAREHIADLVITATHGRAGLKRFFLGSVTERLMRVLPCPLLVLRGSEEMVEGMPENFPFRKILVGCDFSQDSNLALEYGLGMARSFESELHLVHVIEPSGYKNLLKLPHEERKRLKQDLYDIIKVKLNSLVPEDAEGQTKIKTELLSGKPYAELVQYADKNGIDLISLGIRGHGMVEELLVGSTTDRVIRQSPCPVMSICPK